MFSGLGDTFLLEGGVQWAGFPRVDVNVLRAFRGHFLYQPIRRPPPHDVSLVDLCLLVQAGGAVRGFVCPFTVLFGVGTGEDFKVGGRHRVPFHVQGASGGKVVDRGQFTFQEVACLLVFFRRGMRWSASERPLCLSPFKDGLRGFLFAASPTHVEWGDRRYLR